MADLFVQQDPGLDRKRRLAQAMMQRGFSQQGQPVHHPMQGVGRAANALLGAYMAKSAGEEQDAQRETAMAKLAAAMGAQDAQQVPQEPGQGLGVDLGDPSNKRADLVSALMGVNPQAALQYQMGVDKAGREAEAKESARRQGMKDKLFFEEEKLKLAQKYPKPESEFDKYLKTLQAGKLEEDIAKKRRETETAEKAKESAAGDVQNAMDLAVSLRDDPEFGNIYGAFQGVMPSVRQGAVDAEAKRDQLINVLKLAERGKLKGQGTVSDFEAKMIGDAISTLSNPRIGDDAAATEVTRVIEMLKQKGATEGAAPQLQGSDDALQSAIDAELKKRGL